MAMKQPVLIVAVVCLVCLFLFLTKDLGSEYLEKNVMWHVQGVVVDAESGRTLTGAEIHVHCREAKTSKYRESGIAMPSTNYSATVKEDGRFTVEVFGGSIFLEIIKSGYQMTNWNSSTAKGRSSDVTNLTICLFPEH
jgi:hypothetical protein